MQRRVGLGGVVLCALLVGCSLLDEPIAVPPPVPPPTLVTTSAGQVQGVEVDGVLSWRGVPYAAAPVGDLRWRAPRAAEAWQGVRDASAFGPDCLSSPATGATTGHPASEDCLVLNVVRPAAVEEPLPVMVWLHGGGFLRGSGRTEAVRADGLARRGVLVVTLNHRLGRLGFLAHPALDPESADAGLLDQVAALRWVQEEVAAFGGDPDRVTLAGASAGATAVDTLLGSPASQGLLHQAISQSAVEPARTVGLAEATRRGRALAAAAGARTAEELRALDAAEVMSWPLDVFAGEVPVVDGTLVPAAPGALFASGDELPVPYLVGTTDLDLDAALLPALALADDARALLAATGVERLVRAYGSAPVVRRHLLADALFTAPARRRALAHASLAPTYRYRFEAAPAAVRREVGGAPHASELPFVFDADVPVGDEALAEVVSDLWASFVRTGVPTSPATSWPTAGGGALLRLTSDGPRPVASDPWGRRLDLLGGPAPVATTEATPGAAPPRS